MKTVYIINHGNGKIDVKFRDQRFNDSGRAGDMLYQILDSMAYTPDGLPTVTNPTILEEYKIVYRGFLD